MIALPWIMVSIMVMVADISLDPVILFGILFPWRYVIAMLGSLLLRSLSVSIK